jgi:hypothetical protein
MYRTHVVAIRLSPFQLLRVRVLAATADLSCVDRILTGSVDTVVGGGAFFGGSKQLGRAGHRWSLSSAEVKNQWNCDYSPMCRRAVPRDSLTFTFML